jgi:hypothetical protein
MLWIPLKERIGGEREGDFTDNFNGALQEAPFSVSLCTAKHTSYF